MRYTIKAFDCLCATSIFDINGVRADTHDFGAQDDLGAHYADDYCCGNMTFTPKPATTAVLDKYSITTNEYNIIANELAEKLSFGMCGWCS